MLSRSSVYSIRALTWLAQQTDGRHHLARDMAETLGIPGPFLGKVLQPLVARGILHSRRGRSGGFRLDRAATQVRLAEIVEAQESLEQTNACLLGQGRCDEDNVCPLHDTWTRAAGAFRERLGRTTLQEMADYAAAHPGCTYPLPSTDSPRQPGNGPLQPVGGAGPVRARSDGRVASA